MITNRRMIVLETVVCVHLIQDICEQMLFSDKTSVIASLTIIALGLIQWKMSKE